MNADYWERFEVCLDIQSCYENMCKYVQEINVYFNEYWLAKGWGIHIYVNCIS